MWVSVCVCIKIRDLRGVGGNDKSEKEDVCKTLLFVKLF